MGRAITGVFLLAIMAGCFWVWRTFENDIRPIPDAVDILPNDAAIVLRFQPAEWGRFSQRLQAARDLLPISLSPIAHQMDRLDSLRLTVPELQNALKQSPFQWSVHHTGEGRHDWMFSMGLRAESVGALPVELYNIWLGERAGKLREFQGETIWTNRDQPQQFTALFDQRLVVASNVLMVESAIAQAHQSTETQLSETIARNGQPAASLFVRPKPDGIWGAPNQWLGLELEVTDQGSRLFGLSQAMAPKATAAPALPLELLPSGTQTLQWYGASAQQLLDADPDRLPDVNRILAELDVACSCDFKQTFFPASPGVLQATVDGHPFLLLHQPDSAARLHALNAFGTAETADEEAFRFLREPYHMSLLFNDVQQKLDVHWAAGDWLILTNSMEAARQFKREVRAGRTLDLIPTGLVQSAVRDDQCDFIAWNEPWDTAATWPLDLSTASGRLLFRTTTPAGTFLDVQLNAGGVANALGERPEIAMRWEVDLPADGVGRPWLVKNHQTGAREVLVQTADDALQLFAASGQKLWSAKIDGSIEGDVKQIDAFRNGKLQLLFSTAKSIYLLDRNGNLVDGFPIRPGGTFSTPVEAFDYDNNRKYRLIAGQIDGQLVNYTVEGKETRGWSDPSFSSPIEELAHLRIRTKDFLFARETSGDLHLLKRNGKPRFDTDARTPGHAGSPSVIFRSESVGTSQLFYADSASTIFQVQFDTPTSPETLLAVMQGQYVTDADLEGDRKQEIIVVDRQTIKAYSRDLSARFRTPLEATISHPPQLFRFSARDEKIGVTSRDSGQIWLINKEGAIENGFPLEGNSPFSIGDLDLDGRFELAVFTPFRTLAVYQLP